MSPPSILQTRVNCSQPRAARSQNSLNEETVLLQVTLVPTYHPGLQSKAPRDAVGNNLLLACFEILGPKRLSSCSKTYSSTLCTVGMFSLSGSRIVRICEFKSCWKQWKLDTVHVAEHGNC